jgi:solute carrier family 25 uncoupling protein 8/9
VRLQLQGKALAGDAHVAPKYKGMFGTMATIAREEGAASLWKGIVPGLHRQCLFGGLRIGLYEPVSSLHFSAHGAKKIYNFYNLKKKNSLEKVFFF